MTVLTDKQKIMVKSLKPYLEEDNIPEAYDLLMTKCRENYLEDLEDIGAIFTWLYEIGVSSIPRIDRRGINVIPY